MTTEFITVGELADMVGVTVRTIQYYDQTGLLRPSAKGSRNQRLYTRDDVEKLYKILCLKFMGLSLVEIRENLDNYTDGNQVEELIVGKICDMEKDISDILKRFTTLKNLKAVVKNAERADWQHYANVIERFADEGKYFWKLSCVYEENAYAEQPTEPGDSQEAKSVVSRWHRLIADTISLLRRNEAADSESGREIAGRYLEMEADFASLPVGKPHKDFVLFDTKSAPQAAPPPGASDQDSFYQLRYDVNEFIKAAVKSYQEQSAEDGSEDK